MKRVQALLAVLLLAPVAGAQADKFELIRVHEFPGPVAKDGFGAAIATGGIVDSASIADIAVGAPGDAEAGPDAGAVYIYSGRTYELLRVLRPDVPGGRFGHALAFSDIDRDGQDDLVVGAPGHGDGAGAVYVCTKLRRDEPPAPQLVLEGKRSGDQLGWSVAAAPARPGLEVEGLLVGSPGYDLAGRDDAGRALLVRCKGNRLKPEIVFEWTGSTLGAALGRFVQLGGDHDDDGTRDLFVGEPGAGEGRKGTGALRLLDGADGELLHGFAGAADGDGLGAAASSILVHGEGVQYHELLVGAPGGGYALVIDSQEWTERRRLHGLPGEVGFGAYVTQLARLGPEYQFGFAVATTHAGARNPQQFRGLRVYSAEDFAILAQAAFDSVTALVSDELDVESGYEFVVGEAGDSGGTVHILRVRPED
jgi:FG-GAP repeat